jgi:hypothetical protein
LADTLGKLTADELKVVQREFLGRHAGKVKPERVAALAAWAKGQAAKPAAPTPEPAPAPKAAPASGGVAGTLAGLPRPVGGVHDLTDVRGSFGHLSDDQFRSELLAAAERGEIRLHFDESPERLPAAVRAYTPVLDTPSGTVAAVGASLPVPSSAPAKAAPATGAGGDTGAGMAAEYERSASMTADEAKAAADRVRKLPRAELEAMAGATGYEIAPRTSTKKLADELAERIIDRHGAAARRRAIDPTQRPGGIRAGRD